MKEALLNFLKGKTGFTEINTFLKSYLAIQRLPNTAETAIIYCAELEAVVDSGDAVVEGWPFRFLGKRMADQPQSSDGSALPTVYHNLTNTVIKMKLSDAKVAADEAALQDKLAALAAEKKDADDLAAAKEAAVEDIEEEKS
jgi:hypothetical protein